MPSLPHLMPLELASVRQLLLVIDLLGTFVFALSGATLAMREKLDMFGVLVLSVASAVAGGLLRDLLIGAVPPASIEDWRYVGAALLAGLLTLTGWFRFDRITGAIRAFDAAGLGLFAVSGTQKALAYGLNPPMAALLGMLTGIGGGILRDMLVARKPVVLQRDLYAVAALAGSAVVVIGHAMHLPPVPVAGAGAILCFGLRMAAIRYHWNLPARPRD